MTIRAPAVDFVQTPEGLLRTTVKTSNSNAVMKDRVSDSQTYDTSCQFVSIFITLNYRKQMYLFVSQQSVYLKEAVSVTEKTRHSGWGWSQYRNLTAAVCEAYKHVEKRGELRRLAAT